MGFSNLIYMWTLILPLTVLIYYFFRKKYKDQSISSTLFWDEVMQETRVSPYLKHLQRNALLYFQLLALVLFTLALMNPFFNKSEVAGEQVIWIVDTSATMLAGKDQSIFDHHKEEMKALVSEIEGRPLTIITTGEEPNVVLRQETDKTLIHKEIENLKITYEDEQLSKAIDVAQAFVGEASSSIYLFTDFVERSELPIENNRVKWVVKGAEKNLSNVTITKLAATEEGGQLVSLVQIKNESAIEQKLTLSIADESNNVIKEENLTIDPGDELSRMYDQLPLSKVLTANINTD
ncbi:MAG TPA: BatA and WFA domain-containing protein, partial [Ureibacillus sp.]|nr:BatA and WFA domain-containing protein [Ureibacillus sp.]